MIKKNSIQPDTAKNPLRNKNLDKTMEEISSHLSQFTKSSLSFLDSLGSPERINEKEKHHD